MNRPLLLTALSLGACAAHPRNDPMIGDGFDAVRARLGPPIACTYGGGTWTLAYRDASGALVDRAVTVVDEVVIAVAPDLRPNPSNEQNRWNGASIEDVVAALGAGEVQSTSAVGASVRFDAVTLFVADGRVLGPDELVSASTATATSAR